jgi:hypothetical protein
MSYDSDSAPFWNDAIPLISDEGGSISLSFAVERTLFAEWDRRTGALTLSEGDRCVLTTRDPDAFVAGVRLLGHGAEVVYLGFAMTNSRGGWL